MNDETKKLFDAPYKVYETRNGYNVICTNKVLPQLCWTTDKKDANRLARLPELYDALVEATKECCIKCMGRDYRVLLAIPFDYDVTERGCPVLVDVKAENHCSAARWIELIRKVRDGE